MSAVLIGVRFAHFASAMLVFGASMFMAALAPPALRAALQSSVRPLILAASLVAAATAVFWLQLEGGAMTEDWSETIDPTLLSTVMFETAFGQIWLGRLALALILVVLASRRGTSSPWPLTGLAGLFLGSVGLVDHAAMLEGAAGVFERANQALHLIASGFWLGALAPLALCLQRLGEPALKADAGTALRGFSSLGHAAVAAVLATGVVNTFMILGRLPLDFSSPYQTLLAAKILVVAAMILLALYNRYWLVPRLSAVSEAAAALKRNTVAEIALGAVVLALVSAFATFEPF